MESHNMSNEVNDGVGRKEAAGGGGGGGELFLRALALALSMIAAILIGVAKQTKVVKMKVVDGLPPLDVTVHAKWHFLSAFVYAMVSNAIACAYAAISIVVTMKGKMMMTIFDLLIVVLLFSSIGASTAIGVVGYKGNPHVRWNKVCNLFSRFCNQIASALVLSSLAAVLFLLLVVLATIRLHKKST